MDIQSLEAAFHAWKDGLNTGDLDAFWQAFDAEAEILDEDFPWRMDLDDFKDHIAFHAGGKGMWESFEWKPREMHFKVFGETGHVSGFSTFRGKPRDAGFRQRFMGFHPDLGVSGWSLEAGLLAPEPPNRTDTRSLAELEQAPSGLALSLQGRGNEKCRGNPLWLLGPRGPHVTEVAAYVPGRGLSVGAIHELPLLRLTRPLPVPAGRADD